MSIGELGEGAVSAIPKLIETLNDPNPFPRAAAAKSLGQFGPHARSAATELRRVIADPNNAKGTAGDGLRPTSLNEIAATSVRAVAQEALARIEDSPNQAP
jgi:HEAT repeat protein